MESNLIILVYVLWKVYSFMLGYFSIITYSYDSLISTIAVFGFISTTKVYNLFDYDVLYITNYLH